MEVVYQVIWCALLRNKEVPNIKGRGRSVLVAKYVIK